MFQLMTISYYESGERKPGMDTIRALAGVLGGDVLPEAPECHGLALTDNVEENALAMRSA